MYKLRCPPLGAIYNDAFASSLPFRSYPSNNTNATEGWKIRKKKEKKTIKGNAGRKQRARFSAFRFPNFMYLTYTYVYARALDAYYL